MTDAGEHIEVDVDRVVVSRVSTDVYHLPAHEDDADDTVARCGRAPDFAQTVETERAVRAGRTLCHYCDPTADTARNGMAKVLAETDPDAIPDGGVVTCPACGHGSSTVYRCDDCGHDLADGVDSGGEW
jgi:DNA-directed RNA polymerase subunit RPC12/RpoP